MNTKKSKTIFEAAAEDNLIAVKQFIELENVRPTIVNKEGQTAAHIAAEKGNTKILEYLLNKDRTVAFTSDGWGQTLLHLAVQSGSLETVKFLVENYNADPRQDMGDKFGDSSLHAAAESGHLDIFRYFVEDKEVDINLKNHLEQPPAFTAALHARINIIRYIVEKRGTNVTMIDSLGGNILYKSARKGDLIIPKYLLDERNIGFDINHRDVFGETIVHRATRLNHIRFIRYFVEKKRANVNIHDNGGRTPLQLAAVSGSLVTVRLLVEQGGADILAKNIGGQTAVQLTRNKKVISYLERETNKRPRRSVPQSSSIVAATSSQSDATAKEWIRKIDGPSASLVNRLKIDIIDSRQQVDNFLILANATLGSNYRHLIEHEALLSPIKIIEKRIDPVAVEAVGDLFKQS